MKRILIILFLFCNLILPGATYYIDTGGSDATGNGSVSNPWKTLYKACSTVAGSGDIIHVNAGTYNETTRANLAVGVSIIGEGVSSHIYYNYVATADYDAAIYLNSASTITAGNQSISYLRIDGNGRTATRAISVYYRSDVEIHHCTIEDFSYSGIYAGVASLYLTPPAAYVTGISIHDCIFYDLAVYSGVKGHIILEGTDGTLTYNNDFTQTNRTAGSNGTIFTTNFTKGWQFYNSTLTKNSVESTQWNFFIESWHFMGGCDIYGNTFNGGAVNDIVNVEKGAYDYGLKIHDNDFLIGSQIPKGTRSVMALDFEDRGKYESVYIYNNYFKNYPSCIFLLATMNDEDVYIDDIYIYCNIMENVGYSDYVYCYAIFVNGEVVTYDGYVDNINIWNNTILSGSGKSNAGICWQVYGAVTNVSIRNNIIRGFNNYPIQFTYQLAGGTVNILSVENNLYYLNGTDAGYYTGATVTNKTEQNNNVGNPNFLLSTNFHLTALSTLAIAEGINVDLDTDYDGELWNATPSIGAYEYFAEGGSNTYFIDPLGTDGPSHTGLEGDPWKTLGYACTRVGSIGDVIHVNIGTYIETGVSNLAEGVSIEGVGDQSLIKSHLADAVSFGGLIRLVSGSVIDGNQSISKIKLDGDNYAGYKAISVYRRNHVVIHDVTVVNFRIEGIRFGGPGQTHGNEVYNCTITNSGWYYSGDQRPNLAAENTDGMLIHHNTITVTDRGDGRSGTGFESFAGLNGCKFYNCTATNVPQVGDEWAFTFETFFTTGMEMYNNIFSGRVDFGHDCLKGVYDYGVDFHHNTVGRSSLGSSYEEYGLTLEYTSENVIVRNNIFKNLRYPICFTQYNSATEHIENVWIYNNLIYNVGISGAHSGAGINFTTGPVLPEYLDNINIWNNVIIAASGSNSALAGIFLPSGDEVTNISIRNNIIQGFYTAPIYANQSSYGTIDIMSVENNLFYQNGNSNVPLYIHPVPTNLTPDNNNIGNPYFVGGTDFHLTSLSLLAIGEGINVGLTYDYDGELWNMIPSIGAYEYGVKASTVPTVTTTAITDITTITATSGGNVTDDGGEDVTTRGVCWSTGQNPTTASSKTEDGTGTGEFDSDIINLTSGLTYYVRAYATNSVGTAYGNQRSFVASATPPPTGDVLVGNGSILIKTQNGLQLIKIE